MNILGFKTALGFGGSRPNQFRVSLTWPAGLGTGLEIQSLLVTAAALPASNIGPTLVQYRGREVKFAGERTFDPWTITVMNDSNMTLRKKFEAWSNLINERVTNGGVTLPVAYMADLKVEQLSRNDVVAHSYTLRGAFPSTVSEVGLSYGANDVISEFTVVFQYQYFTTDTAVSGQET